METYYTIIKIATNSVANDSLSIGLLLHNGHKFFLHFSTEKKSFARQLLHRNGDIVDFAVKQIEQKVNEVNDGLNSQKRLFKLENLLTSDKFSHLNLYSNGIIRFTEPSFLNDNVDEEKFVKLFKLLIDKTYLKEKPEVDLKELNFNAIIESKLIKRVKNKVHTNFELTPERLPGLFFNFNIDCIGLNGAFIGAKSIPFFKKNETIVKELSHYFSLISTLNLLYTRKSANDKFYIIGDEPSDIESKEHRTWENIMKNNAVSLIYAEEADIIADEIEEKNAIRFIGI